VRVWCECERVWLFLRVLYCFLLFLTKYVRTVSTASYVRTAGVRDVPGSCLWRVLADVLHLLLLWLVPRSFLVPCYSWHILPFHDPLFFCLSTHPCLYLATPVPFWFEYGTHLSLLAIPCKLSSPANSEYFVCTRGVL
jgi:hypothetical protein